MNTPDDLFCPVCKIENLPGAIRCAFCQSPLIPDPADPLATLEVAGAPAVESADWELDRTALGSFRGIILWVEKSPNILKIETREAFILGRNLENLRGKNGEEIIDLSSYGAYEKGVSRRHLLVQAVDGGYGIADLDSTNGTWLNQQRLLSNRFYALERENEIRLGHLLMRLSLSFFDETQDSFV
jgi:hypothetical protein